MKNLSVKETNWILQCLHQQHYLMERMVHHKHQSRALSVESEKLIKTHEIDSYRGGINTYYNC